MIEAGKKYLISIEMISELSEFLLRRFEGIVDPIRMCGEVTHVHSFGFLFKPDDIPKGKNAEFNILWDILKWVIPETDD